MMKKYKRWRMGPSSILSPFLLSRAVFSTWQTYPTHFPQILDLSPPRAVQLGMQRGNPCSTPVDVLRRQHALGQCKEGVKLSSKWDSVISQLLESQHLLSFDDQIQGIFKQNVPIRFIPNIMTNKLLKSLCYIGSFRDRGRFCEGFACNELLE